MSKNTIAFDVIFCIVRVDLLLNQLSMSTQQPLLTADTSAPLFTENAIRRQWHNDERYFSVVDVVAVLTNSFNPTDYLKKLRKRDEELAIYLGTNCPQVEMLTWTGKKRKTLAGNTENLLRIIQSIPSPKAEPFKQRLASLGDQRVEEVNDPELGIQRAKARAVQVYKSRGMNATEIQERLHDIEVRNEFTNELKTRGIKDGLEYALLTNISYQWSGKTAQEYKEYKGLTKKDNLRDHMSLTEMTLTSLSEIAGKEIAKSRNAQGFNDVQTALFSGADIAKKAREALEEKAGKTILNDTNRLTPRQKELRKEALQEQKKLGKSKT